MTYTISFGSKQQRLITFSLLYLSEGIPIGFTTIALAAYLRMQGIGLTEIGAFMAMLFLPWAFKWAWAPLVDLIQIRRFGPNRAWIFAAQFLMILTLCLIFFLDVARNLRILTTLMVIHNIFAATQDIAIDALAVQVLPENERGIANGFMFGASRLGQTIGGSVAILIMGAFSINVALLFVLVDLTMILVLVTLRIREPHVAVNIYDHQMSLLRQVLRNLRIFGIELYRGFFASGIGPKIGVVFSLLPSGALALLLALASTMQVDMGMNEGQIARFTMFTTILGALGCITGGWISDRIGHRKALGLWYVLTMLPTLYMASQFVGTNSMQGVTLREFTIAMFCYSFASGLVFGTSTAVFMGLTNPMVAGTQFTGYMALCNLVYSYSNLWQGRFAEAYGYANTLKLDGILVLMPLILIPFLKPSSRAER